MDTSRKFTDQNLQGEELENYTEKFLSAKFDRDRKKRWQKILAEKHNVNPPSTGRVVKSKTRRLYLWIGAVAAAILLLFILNPKLLQFSKPSYEQLANNYLQRDFFQNQEMAKGSKAVEELKLVAVTAYNKKDFFNAIKSYEEIIISGATEEQYFFFLGMSYLYDKNYPKAIEQLSQIVEDENRTKFKKEAQWFLSLAYLENNNPDKAKPLLEIIKNGDWKADKASRLLKYLE